MSQEDKTAQQEVMAHFDPSLELHHSLQIVSTRRWLLLMLVAFAFFLFVLWGFFGSIPVQISGRGIVVAEGGLFTMQAVSDGTVDRIHVSAGDVFQEDSALMQISDPELEVRLQAAKQKLEALQDDFERVEAEIKREEASHREAVEEALDLAQFALQQRKGELPLLKETLQERQELFDEGLVSKDVLRSAQDNVTTRLIEIERLEFDIAEAHSKLAKAYRGDELERKRQAIFAAQEAYDILLLHKQQNVVKATETGRVLEVLVSRGAVVKKGQAVLWAEAEDLVDGKKVHQLVSFFSVSEGKRLEPGDKIYIELSTVEAQEQGMLEGSVTALSSYAISRYRMGQDIHNENLIAYLMSGQEAVVRCDITLSSHPDDPKRYLWTTGYGPDEEVSSGNVATVRGVVEGNRPIDFVFPMWRLRRLQQ